MRSVVCAILIGASLAACTRPLDISVLEPTPPTPPRTPAPTVAVYEAEPPSDVTDIARARCNSTLWSTCVEQLKVAARDLGADTVYGLEREKRGWLVATLAAKK